MKERLQKILARAGYGSRRTAEALIAAARVRVNGIIVTRQGLSADSETDRIEVDGELLTHSGWERVYLAMHKPAGCLTTAADPHGRPTVMELLPEGLPPHVLPVGRLDRETEGLLLFTNDGELAYRLTHPRYEITKQYFALVAGKPSADALHQLRSGVVIQGGKRTAPARVAVTGPPPGHAHREGHSWVRLAIHEGRKRQVRLMCAAVGYPVRALVRTRVGPVDLGSLRRGAVRRLKRREIEALLRAVGL